MTKGKLYLALQAVVCVALVAWLSLSAIAIYREGSTRRAEHPMESIYTPEGVAEKLAPIAPLFIAGLCLLVAGLALGIEDENAQKPVKDAAVPRPAGLPKKTGALQAALIVAAVVLILAGVFNGSARDVLYKAITICSECVGLG